MYIHDNDDDDDAEGAIKGVYRPGLKMTPFCVWCRGTECVELYLLLPIWFHGTGLLTYRYSCNYTSLYILPLQSVLMTMHPAVSFGD